MSKTQQFRKEELVCRGWTPLEADEIIAMEEGTLKPEDAELVNHASSDRPVNPKSLNLSKEMMTSKQKENIAYLYGVTIREWKKNRKKLEKAT